MPRLKKDSVKEFTRGVYDLSLGISIVVAVLLGFGLGYGLYKLTGLYFFIFIGLGYGVLAAILNVFKAYKRLKKDFDVLQKEEKYQYMSKKNNESN